ncbi:MAG TPA: glycosyltransferase [Aggregatilineales bacterium]|nr:glycosyltransferase [Anaerolineales bacterium]HRE49374.1 glycosyltransferase [Aggregatilineales bacterium]
MGRPPFPLTMRILLIHPLFIRLNDFGACEQDRLSGLEGLLRLGHTVQVVTMSGVGQAPEQHRAFYAERGVPAVVLPYQRSKRSLLRLARLGYLDGAAWEYGTPTFQAAVAAEIQAFAPEVVWCHGSYMWSPALQARARGISVVVRSVNFESLHHRDEVSRLTFAHRLRVFAKKCGEENAARGASVLAAISPAERALYESIPRHSEIATLPLRALPAFLRPPRRIVDDEADQPTRPLRVFFMGSSYNIPHNRAALLFILNEIVPRARAAAPGVFEFHLLGGKIPAPLQASAAPDVIFDGFVPDLEAHLAGMDIALPLWRFGRGMQQKVFEALCRAFPVITHPRALAGYDFRDGEHLLHAAEPDEVISALLKLREAAYRQRLSEGAARQSAALFSGAILDAEVARILARAADEKA